jgi:hypothetical protein
VIGVVVAQADEAAENAVLAAIARSSASAALSPIGAGSCSGAAADVRAARRRRPGLRATGSPAGEHRRGLGGIGAVMAAGKRIDRSEEVARRWT